jgi:LSD1 subclass zinc finger protein
MNVAFACPQCQETCRTELSDGTTQLACDHCGELLRVPAGALSVRAPSCTYAKTCRSVSAWRSSFSALVRVA